MTVLQIASCPPKNFLGLSTIPLSPNLIYQLLTRIRVLTNRSHLAPWRLFFISLWNGLAEKDKELKTSGDMQNFFSKLAKAGLVTTPAREKPQAEKSNHQPPLENVAAPVTGFNEPQVETSDHFRVSGGAN